jgi:hypothetical protein
MKRTTRLVLVAACVAALSLCGTCLAQSTAELAHNFQNPPASARPWVYWFWLNGNITREGITADLEAMKRVGIGGVLIMEVDQGVPLGPVDFAGAQWRELFAFMLSEANRLGIEVNMNNDAGWNGSGGPWITPEKAMQKVVWTETPAQGPVHFEAVLPQPKAVAGYYRDIAVLAFPTAGDYRISDIEAKAAYVRRDFPPRAEYGQVAPEQTVARGEILDLSAKLDADGKLTWDVPPGRWTILRMGHTPTGAQNAPSPASGRGLECDKLSKEGVEAAFEGLMGKLIADSPALVGKTLVATHIDSWENGSQNWTPRFREEFQRRRGYDPLPFLPVMTGRVVDSLEVSERFLWDLRQTVSDLIVENYAGHMHELAHRHGLRLTIEAYGDTVVANLPYAGQCDEPMGEFWWPNTSMNGSVLEMASAAHVYGKPICGAEAFTADNDERWLATPGMLKPLGDRAFCAGINRFVFHRYALQPWIDRRPGMTMGPWGQHYERTQTWWEQTGPWHQYLARCQYLLQSGQPVVDFLCLAPEGAPRSVNPPAAILRAGYKADSCPPEVVLHRLSVKDGQLALPEGMTYRALVLPNAPTMTLPLLRRIGELAAEGATIIGTPPTKAPGLTDYPQCDAQVKQLADEIWGSGKIITTKTPQEVLAAAGVGPDFTSDRSLDFTHRRIGDADVYFVANPLSRGVNARCTFRISGRPPELWDPETGKTQPAPAYVQGQGGTQIPLRLEAGQSLFVVFGRPAQADPVVEITRDGQSVLTPPSRAAQITIRRAIWAPIQAGKQSRDVTQQVQRIVDRGVRSFVVADLASEGDPARNIVKTLHVEYEVDGQTRTVEAKDPERIRFDASPDAKITIRRAIWGVAGDPVYGPKDVTEQVRRKVERGATSFTVAELAAEGDPAPMVLKVLRVEYEVDGKSFITSARDPEVISFDQPADEVPPVQLEDAPDGSLCAAVREPGTYRVRWQSGRTFSFDGQATLTLAVPGPWEISFAPGWGAPPQLSLPNLISWSEHPEPGVRYFSGTATYRKTLTLPTELVAGGRRLTLDLGTVEVCARVRLNGQDLGILWHAPYCVDITTAARPGDNALEVEVTNLWPNRMIGDEQLPEDSERHANGTLVRWPDWLLEGKPSPTGRYTFTTWRLWSKSSELQPSGLLGPVQVQSRVVVPIRP